MPDTKEQLYQLCSAYITTREAEIRKTIEEAREAANNETKSSAGDKYETGRETMQQEIDLNLTRLNDLNALKLVLERINTIRKSDAVVPGSVVYTNGSNYYMAISAGVLRVDGRSFYAVSAASPVGVQLLGKGAGETFVLNGKTIAITAVE